MAFDWASAGSAVGGLLGASYSNDRNMEEARRARAWSSYMSGTAHQREVADLRKAGLNPILSATGGSGASTPSASQGTVEDPSSKAISSALEAKRMAQENEAIKSQTELNKKTGDKAEADKDVAKANEALIKAQIPAAVASAKYEALQNTMKHNILNAIKGVGDKGTKKWESMKNSAKENPLYNRIKP